MTAPVIVTGSAGFIGFHLSQRLLSAGQPVIGVDAMTDYYDVRLKERRHEILSKLPGFQPLVERVETPDAMRALFASEKPRAVVHLAAQAGVRYSIDAPRSYVDANLIGTYEILEAARATKPDHLLIASTSSVYGANETFPYAETQKADSQMSFYAATKKAGEAMAHSYAHLYGIPTSLFRFFTVYGPWGRPDMALFKFVRAMREGKDIDVYNNGQMRRDFTYVDDLVAALGKLIEVPPIAGHPVSEADSLSPVAPCRVINIGNSAPVELMVFIKAIEHALGFEAEKRFLPMQAGDVPATWADTGLLQSLIGDTPRTDIAEGVRRFVDWYLESYEAGDTTPRATV